MTEDDHMDEEQFELHAADQIDDRDPRSSMMIRCDVVDALGRRFPCFLRNISRTGISARGCTGLCVGQQISVILPVIGAIGGVIRWVNRDRFGIQLEAEIMPEMLRFAGAPVEAARPKFEPLPLHRPVTDYKRPGLRHAVR